MPQTFNELERQQFAALKQKYERDMDCISCPKCGSQWFEEIKLDRYKADHNLVLGQDIPTRPGSVSYRFLRCSLCSNMIEPRVQSYGRDLATDDYNHLLDTLEGKFDERPKEKKTIEDNDAISSEEC